MTNIVCVHKNTLSCEAIFRIAPDGHYFIVSQCDGPTEPHIENRVYIFDSYDYGKTWEKPRLVTPDNGLAQYQTEVAVIGDEILIFMTEHDGNFCLSHSYILSSKDSGKTFLKKVDIPFFKGFCFVRGMIQINDEYLFPYQNYEIGEKENKELHGNGKKIWEGDYHFVECGIIKTKDFINWERSKTPAFLEMRWNDKKRWVWAEPTVAKVGDKLLMLLRYDPRGWLFASESFDGGNTWSTPKKTEIPNPSNKPKIINWKDNIVLLNTPQSECGFSHRTPLAIWISKDGENWFYKENLCDYNGWISYPDGIIENDKLLLAFEYNRNDVYFVEKDLSEIDLL